MHRGKRHRTDTASRLSVVEWIAGHRTGLAFARSAKLAAAGFTAGERTSRSDANKAFVAEGRSRERRGRRQKRSARRIEGGTFLSKLLPHGRTKRPFAQPEADVIHAAGRLTVTDGSESRPYPQPP